MQSKKSVISTKVISALFLGIIVGALSFGIIYPAREAFQNSFDLYQGFMVWMFSLFIIFYLLAIPAASKIQEKYGIKGTYAIFAGLFTVGSLLCALTGLFPYIIITLIFRAIEGLGAGGLVAVTFKLLNSFSGDDNVKKYNSLAIKTLIISLICGPIVGSIITYLSSSWALLFYIITAISIVLMILIIPLELNESPVKNDDFTDGEIDTNTITDININKNNKLFNFALLTFAGLLTIGLFYITEVFQNRFKFSAVTEGYLLALLMIISFITIYLCKTLFKVFNNYIINVSGFLALTVGYILIGFTDILKINNIILYFVFILIGIGAGIVLLSIYQLIYKNHDVLMNKTNSLFYMSGLLISSCLVSGFVLKAIFNTQFRLFGLVGQFNTELYNYQSNFYKAIGSSDAATIFNNLKNTASRLLPSDAAAPFANNIEKSKNVAESIYQTNMSSAFNYFAISLSIVSIAGLIIALILLLRNNIRKSED